MEKLEKIPAWQLTRIAEARNDGKTVHFASLMDLCLSQEFGVGTQIPEIQRPSLYSEVTLLFSVHRARFICVTDDG